MRQKQKGFVIVGLVALLPVLLAGSFALGAGGLMIADRRAVLSACRADLVKGLRQAAPPIRQLLALNPAAVLLRARAAQLTAQIVASGMTTVAAVIFAARLAEVHKQRQNLDRYQKSLVATARLHLRAGQARAFRSVKSSSQWLKIRASLPTPAQPAVRPTSPDLAPEWELIEPFPQAQTLEQKWIWSFTVQGPAANFLRASHHQEETCAATLNDQKNWRAEIR